MGNHLGYILYLFYVFYLFYLLYPAGEPCAQQHAEVDPG